MTNISRAKEIKGGENSYLYPIAQQLNAAASFNADVRARAVLTVGIHGSNFAQNS
jgi:hypothetical protein